MQQTLEVIVSFFIGIISPNTGNAATGGSATHPVGGRAGQ